MRAKAKLTMATPVASPKHNDILIAVMGLTGSGKSTFIKNITGREDVGIGHGLCSETIEICSYTVVLNEKTFILVDTPGFDDTFEADEVIVGRIADWLSTTYQTKRYLNGILYLHRIDAPRQGGSSQRSLRMLKEICGREAYKNIVLGTTGWDLLPDPAEGITRERELREGDSFWKGMIKVGAQCVRMNQDVQSGKKLLLNMGNNETTALKIQTEMVEEGKAFEDTTAATELDHALTQLKIELAEKLHQAELRAQTQVAIAEADRIFREEEAKANHKLRLEEHARQEARKARLRDKEAKERLERLEREHEKALEAKREEARKQEDAAIVLIQKRMEETRLAESRVRDIEARTRMDRQVSQTLEIENQIEVWNYFLKQPGIVRILVEVPPILNSWCDTCLAPIGNQDFYACNQCLGPTSRFCVCLDCFNTSVSLDVPIEEFMRQEVPQFFTSRLQTEVDNMNLEHTVLLDDPAHLREAFITRMTSLINEAQDAAVEAYRQKSSENSLQLNQLMTPGPFSSSGSFPNPSQELSRAASHQREDTFHIRQQPAEPSWSRDLQSIDRVAANNALQDYLTTQVAQEAENADPDSRTDSYPQLTKEDAPHSFMLEHTDFEFSTATQIPQQEPEPNECYLNYLNLDWAASDDWDVNVAT
ncbi:hypothetical protein V502_09670 [Pseudogymnoascus sp. VKM F-4520 (FW-2644)]|nr:hypothetical protein V502_09670 [Pseudogymnoascus sp. VKM F-4520 (FW-2644)]